MSNSSDPSVLQMILNELRAFRADLNELRNDLNEQALKTAERLTVVEQGLKPLLPNGQPGKIAEMSKDIRKLQDWKVWCMGMAAAVGAAVAFLVQVVAMVVK